MLRQSVGIVAVGLFGHRRLQVYNSHRKIHSRNKKALEFVAKGWNALKEVDRVIDYAEFRDKRLFPYLIQAKESFELALEVDGSSTQARYWLSKLHLKYHWCPGACQAVGAALLVEAANMGDSEAQYELACLLRAENDYVYSDQQASYYLQCAVDQLHPGALYLLGAIYLAGDCVSKDVSSAMWCFHKAAEKGHVGAAIMFGSLLLRGTEVPKSVGKFELSKSTDAKTKNDEEAKLMRYLDLARKHFQIVAKAGSNLGLVWLKRLDDEEIHLFSHVENHGTAC